MQRLQRQICPLLLLFLQSFCGRSIVLFKLRKFHLRYSDVLHWKHVLPPFIVNHVQKTTRSLPALNFTVHFNFYSVTLTTKLKKRPPRMCGKGELTLWRDAEILRELWNCNGACCRCFDGNSVLKSIRFHGREVIEVLGAESFGLLSTSGIFNVTVLLEIGVGVGFYHSDDDVRRWECLHLNKLMALATYCGPLHMLQTR